MASCGGMYKEHDVWMYGSSFCVECSLQALTLDPEAMLTPLLAKLQVHRLRVACAARVIHALTGEKYRILLFRRFSGILGKCNFAELTFGKF